MTEACETGSPQMQIFTPNYKPREQTPPPFANKLEEQDNDDKHGKPGFIGKKTTGKSGMLEANASLLKEVAPGRPDIARAELHLPMDDDVSDSVYRPPGPKIEKPRLSGSAGLQSRENLPKVAAEALGEIRSTASPDSRHHSIEPLESPFIERNQQLALKDLLKEDPGPSSFPLKLPEKEPSSLSKYLISAPEGSAQDSLPALLPPEAAKSPDNGNHRLPPIQTQLGHLPLAPPANNSSTRVGGTSPYSLPSVTAASSPLSRIDSATWEHARPQLAPPKLSPGSFSQMSPASLKDILVNTPPAPQSYNSWRPTQKSVLHLLYDPPSISKSPAATNYPTPTEHTPPGSDPTPFNPVPVSHSNGAPQTGTFKCTHPGCTAAPFQTQYLLNSHANVHSQDRPHFCPIDGCSRGPGGKGFKRKNEMIRHGLVHNSPGYVCPFCPDQQHKYPRPDNLQRHVRVHHVDKSKDDPALRHVLSQRPEGSARGRRRRMNAQ